MNTQYENHSVYLAVTNYKIRQRARRLKYEIAAFMSVFAIFCAAVYFFVASLPY